MARPRRFQDSSSPRRFNRHADSDAHVPRLDEDELLESLAGDENAVLLVLDGVQDPHNLGACLRTANAAGVKAVVAPKDRAVALTEVVRQVACGAAAHTPFVRVTNLARFIERLQGSGFWVVGTSDGGDRDFYSLDLSGRLAIVLGAEGRGVRRLTAEKCDFLAAIPMTGQVECLNVSVAAGVCLFEVLRQRRAAGGAAGGAEKG